MFYLIIPVYSSVRSETPPFHLSIFGAGYFWDSGLQLKAGALSFSKFCPFLAISRDHSRESNCVELDGRSGEPVANYVVTKEDEKNLIHTLVSVFTRNLVILYATLFDWVVFLLCGCSTCGGILFW